MTSIVIRSYDEVEECQKINFILVPNTTLFKKNKDPHLLSSALFVKNVPGLF